MKRTRTVEITDDRIQPRLLAEFNLSEVNERIALINRLVHSIPEEHLVRFQSEVRTMAASGYVTRAGADMFSAIVDRLRTYKTALPSVEETERTDTLEETLKPILRRQQ